MGIAVTCSRVCWILTPSFPREPSSPSPQRRGLEAQRADAFIGRCSQRPPGKEEAGVAGQIRTHIWHTSLHSSKRAGRAKGQYVYKLLPPPPSPLPVRTLQIFQKCVPPPGGSAMVSKCFIFHRHEQPSAA